MRNFIFILLTATLLVFSSCHSGSNFDKKMDRHDRLVLKKAIQIGDASAAMTSVVSLLTRDSNNTGLYDTLAQICRNTNNISGILYASAKVLKTQPNNISMLELFAISSSAKGNNRDAIASYNKLFELKKNTRYLLEIALIYYNSKAFADAKQVMSNIINNPSSKTDMTTVPVGEGQSVSVPVLAALYNVLGFDADLGKDSKTATEYYKKALEIAPDFSLAKNNLANVGKAR